MSDPTYEGCNERRTGRRKISNGQKGSRQVWVSVRPPQRNCQLPGIAFKGGGIPSISVPSAAGCDFLMSGLSGNSFEVGPGEFVAGGGCEELEPCAASVGAGTIFKALAITAAILSAYRVCVRTKVWLL